MKKEILRINNLNYHYSLMNKLENISLCILEGECVGFLGLTYSGKDLLVQLLDGALEEDMGRSCICIGGQTVTEGKMLQEKVYHIAADNYVIDDWTVAEYIGLVDCGWLRMLLYEKLLETEVRQYFQDLNLDVDVTRKMRELTELEKRVVDLVKAHRKGARVVIIEDEFEGMDATALEEFARTMKHIIRDGMAVIVNSYSNLILSLLSDKYVIFNKGRIVKKCSKSYIRSGGHLERFLMGSEAGIHRRNQEGFLPENGHDREIVYQVRKVRLPDGQRKDFAFARGDVITFLVLDRKEKERLFMTLAGRETAEGTEYVLNGRQYQHVSCDLFIREKVVSVRHLGNREEIFAHMSVGENLLLPSLCKISSMEYIASSRRMPRIAVENMEMEEELLQSMEAEEMGINVLIGITLERWSIYNPRVLVLFEPFALCDIKGTQIVKDYIKKFAARGISVIIVKTREEYVEDISDQIIRID